LADKVKTEMKTQRTRKGAKAQKRTNVTDDLHQHLRIGLSDFLCALSFSFAPFASKIFGLANKE